MITNRFIVEAFDFASVSGCDQLVGGPTHGLGGTLNLLMTEVHELLLLPMKGLLL